MKKVIITITGIRPDFIRMSEVFKKLDQNFKHILIHTGQHFDYNLSDVFFKDLNIREPDFNWGIGSNAGDHFDQLANLTLKIKEFEYLFKAADLVLFLGDSNSVLASVLLKKMGVKVGHIEAGMRSGDKSMFEEINRTICDHCSDIHFCYHQHYVDNLVKENIHTGLNVGNTITEVILQHIPTEPKKNWNVTLDIHRPENFLNKERLQNILQYANYINKQYRLPIALLSFSRTIQQIKEWNLDLGEIIPISQMSFKDYISRAYHSKYVISDSGTAQEELAFLKTPVLVPRSFTERWESVHNSCSVMLDVDGFNKQILNDAMVKLDNLKFHTKWLGEGNTSDLIIQGIENANL